MVDDDVNDGVLTGGGEGGVAVLLADDTAPEDVGVAGTE